MRFASLSRPSQGGPGPFRRIQTLAAAFLLFLGCAAGPARAGKPAKGLSDSGFLDLVEQRTFRFFWDTADPVTGLVPDRHPSPSFASTAAVGFGLTAYVVGVERGYVTRAQAADRVLRTLRFLERAPQGDAPRGMAGHKGFFYHFLDMKTGLRFQQVELSTIDTAILMAGGLTCQSYFSGPDPREAEIRAIVDHLNGRIDWTWAMPRGKGVALGWTPEGGFITYDWTGYNEAMILLVQALGSTAHPAPEALWPEFTRHYVWAPFQGQEHVSFGPLFGHQFSQVWLDLRGVRDATMAAKGLDYAENTRRATYAQRAYAMANPGKWKGYGPDMWGFSACDGPADITLDAAGARREFRTYAARGVCAQGILDDGTLTPNAPAGSLPFAPEICLPALREMAARFGDHLFSTYGFLDSFNETFPAGTPVRHGRVAPGLGWVDTDYLGIDQGLILAMVENYRSGLIWKLLRTNPTILRGMRRAGFRGGWLEAAPASTPVSPR
jgi:hypothetical protein